MQKYNYFPTKGKLAGRRFEVQVNDMPLLPSFTGYCIAADTTYVAKALYERDMHDYYRNVHLHAGLEVFELFDGKEKKRITPSRTDPVHTFEKICRNFVVKRIQDDPGNSQVSLVTLVADSAPKTF